MHTTTPSLVVRRLLIVLSLASMATYPLAAQNLGIAAPQPAKARATDSPKQEQQEATTLSIPKTTPRARAKRPEHIINTLADLPRYVRPGSILHFPFANLNYLKYIALIGSQGFVQQYSLNAAVPGQETPAAAPEGNSDQDKEKPDERPAAGLAPEPSVADQAQALIKDAKALVTKVEKLAASGNAFRDLTDGLLATYQADYWSNLATDSLRRRALTRQAFSVDLVSARQFAAMPKNLQDQVTAAIARAGSLSRRAEALKNKATTAAEKKVVAEATDATAAAAGISKNTLADLTAYLAANAGNEEYQQQLTVLGDALVKLRGAPSPQLTTTILLPDDKDGVELTLEYKLRTDYKMPPGLALSTPPKHVVTLWLAPRFRITGSVGPYFSGLVDRRFVFLDDSIATPPAAGATSETTTTYRPGKRIEQENDDEWFSAVGASVFMHFEWRLIPEISVGAALGVGAQNDGLRALLGPSVVFGNDQRVALSGGVAAGRVTRLARGYSTGPAHVIPDPGTSQVPTRIVNKTSWFVSLSYNISTARK